VVHFLAVGWASYCPSMLFLSTQALEFRIEKVEQFGWQIEGRQNHENRSHFSWQGLCPILASDHRATLGRR
jgi:hypothetical protein